MPFLTTRHKATATAAGRLRGPDSAANGRRGSTSDARTVPLSADERTKRLDKQFSAYADMFESMGAQAPAVLRQLVAEFTASVEPDVAPAGVDPDARR
ncbi:PE domain-containing protein [Mycobacterium parmense]|uniref:Uncharacterized protein n=1 Tax=Mycobacterium parmense TaxID=185642 RepID=A0A7I7Z1Z7_9MYCO|nr:PE domain-containing protein [Mycobacterium parmense]MCV7352070.1 PE domain-containing protein [Mycobacterium parmense]ORW56081.1 hypothetical protein AWC20_15180 [Mycobacterium parmense]BBZ48215.1 hypothetical protein MPRM_54960 [Mycobacterium parmense]